MVKGKIKFPVRFAHRISVESGLYTAHVIGDKKGGINFVDPVLGEDQSKIPCSLCLPDFCFSVSYKSGAFDDPEKQKSRPSGRDFALRREGDKNHSHFHL